MSVVINVLVSFLVSFVFLFIFIHNISENIRIAWGGGGNSGKSIDPLWRNWVGGVNIGFVCRYIYFFRLVKKCT